MGWKLIQKGTDAVYGSYTASHQARILLSHPEEHTGLIIPDDILILPHLYPFAPDYIDSCSETEIALRNDSHDGSSPTFAPFPYQVWRYVIGEPGDLEDAGDNWPWDGDGLPVTLTMDVSPEVGGTTIPAVGVHYYPTNTVVPVSAVAAEGYVFTGWTGDTPDGSLLTMDEDKELTANFELIEETETPTRLEQFNNATDRFNGGLR